jgi:hypothetical protein
MTQSKILQKIEVKSLLTKDQLNDLNPKKVFVIAVSDDKNQYQGYRQLNDQIPENWNLFKVDGSLSLFPIVQGG